MTDGRAAPAGDGPSTPPTDEHGSCRILSAGHRLYRSFGFRVVHERAGMTYLKMALELREDDERWSIRGRD